MKSTLLFISAFAFQTGFAQFLKPESPNHKIDASEFMALKTRHAGYNKTQDGQQLYLDYSVANYDSEFFVWRFSSNYTDYLNYVGLAFDTIAGFTDLTDTEGSVIDFDYQYGYRIDTIFMQVTHENNSGAYDYITLNIVELTSAGVPTTNVLWSQKDSSNTSLSPGGNWVGSGAGLLLTYTPTFFTPSDKKVGIVLQYNDTSLTDTFSIAAGYVPQDVNGDTALQSNFRNSFMRFPPNINSITRNANVGYGSPVGSGGWFFAQNWAIWAYITLDPTSVEENPLSPRVVSASPNPSTDKLTLNVNLPSPTEASYRIIDVSGREVFSKQLGNLSAGLQKVEINTVSLTNGYYFVEFASDFGVATQKFSVAH